MILIGADPLTRFLNRAAEKPFVWGEFDCLLWLADWIAERREIDPAVNLRGTYSTMLAAAKVVRDVGGMTALVDACLRDTIVRRTDELQRGDIAIVEVPGVGGENFGSQAGGIILNGTVALLCQDGLLFNHLSDSRPVSAWRI